ncbi:hypothetical protein ACFSR9_07415 [Deinococcus taklimakanensis]|uniref:Uncharacterized protein n=1 Tax=Deinococcus taklimakanensis TaxID=536443 RepID=A0ABW5P2M4_9DEIO
MTLEFRATIASLMLYEERLNLRLASLTLKDVRELADWASRALPEVDGLICLPHASALGTALGQLRGLPVVTAEFNTETGMLTLPPEDRRDRFLGRDLGLVTTHLQGGLPELELCLRSVLPDLRVTQVITAVERTNAGGRARLELQGVQVHAALLLADTPRGLVFERRFPTGEPSQSVPLRY